MYLNESYFLRKSSPCLRAVRSVPICKYTDPTRPVVSFACKNKKKTPPSSQTQRGDEIVR